MSRKNKVIPGTLYSFVVYEQRFPTKREDRRGDRGDPIWEANLVKIGEVKATHAGEALDLAKTRGMTRHPIIWGAETESKRDRYKQKRERDEVTETG